MNKLFHHIIQWYALRFPFPHRGLKYFMRLLTITGLKRSGFIKKTAEGVFCLYPRDHIQRYIFWYGAYEQKEKDFLKKILRPGMVFFDIGSNIGYYSIIAAQKLQPNGMVYSFEASGKAIDLFKKNITLNNTGNIIINHVAISDNQGSAEVYYSNEENIGMTGLSPAANFDSAMEKVKSITIDGYMLNSKIHRVDIIKIDIEGSELKALHGMINTLQTHRPVLLVEILNETLNRFQAKACDIYNFLESHEYTPYELLDKDNIRKIKDKNFESDLVLFVHKDRRDLLSDFIK